MENPIETAKRDLNALENKVRAWASLEIQRALTDVKKDADSLVVGFRHTLSIQERAIKSEVNEVINNLRQAAANDITRLNTDLGELKADVEKRLASLESAVANLSVAVADIRKAVEAVGAAAKDAEKV